MAPPITQSSTPSLLPNTSQFSFRSTSTLSLESAFEVERRRKEGEGFNQLRTALPPSHLSQTEGGRVYEGIGWEKSEVGSEGGWESKGTRMSVRRGDWKTYSENIKVRLRVSRGAIGVYGRDREEWNIVGKTLWVTKEGETVLEMDQEAYIDAVLGAKYERTTFWSRLFGCRPDSSDRARSHTPFLMTHEHQLRIPSSSLFPSSPRRLCHLFSAFRSQSVEAGGFLVTRGWIDEAGHRIKVKAVWKFEDLLMGVQEGRQFEDLIAVMR